MLKHIIILTVFSMSLLGCHIDVFLEKEKEPVVCFETETYEDSYYISPIDTGILRDEPIKIIDIDLFFDRLKKSNIWKYVDDVGKGTSTFMYSYGFPEINGFLYTESRYYKQSKDIIVKIKYSGLNLAERKAKAHNLSEQEKQAMLEVINLVIDDKQKANEIMEELYQKYLAKLKSNDLLGDGETLHSYVLYDGKQFELFGIHRTTHQIPDCNKSYLTELVIQ